MNTIDLLHISSNNMRFFGLNSSRNVYMFYFPPRKKKQKKYQPSLRLPSSWDGNIHPKNRRTGPASLGAQPIEAGHPARPMATKEIRFQTFEDQKKTFQLFCVVESFTVIFIEFYWFSDKFFFEMKEVDDQSKESGNVKNQINSFCKCKFQTFHGGHVGSRRACSIKPLDPNPSSFRSIHVFYLNIFQGWELVIFLHNFHQSGNVGCRTSEAMDIQARRKWNVWYHPQNRFENDSRFKYYISSVQHWSIWEVEILPYGHMYVVYLCTVLYYQYIHIFACIKRLVWY